MAAAAKRMAEEEEEEMTNYTNQDLAENWEFKIVRSSIKAFKKPETLHKLMDEESQAGWIMVEKFDNSRVRFKRPVSERERDRMQTAGVDPYRTTYGMSENMLAVWILVIVFGIMGAVILIAILATGGS